VANLRNGSNQHTKKNEGGSIDLPTSIADAAKAFQVSEPSVKRAKHVADNGDKTVVEAVKAGAITVNAGKAARLFGVSWSLVDRGTDPLMPKAKERQKRKPDNSVVENLPQQNSVCLWKICHRHAPTTTGPDARAISPRGVSWQRATENFQTVAPA
jgi:hypothetical protein